MPERGRGDIVEGFRDIRIRVLILVVLLCGALILVRGPKWGIDITGGSRIILELQGSKVTLNFAWAPDNEEIDNLIVGLRENLNTFVVSLDTYEEVMRNRQITLEIGKTVTENQISQYLGEGISVGEITKEIPKAMQEEVMKTLNLRVDPYGILGTQFKPLGTNFVLFEVSLPLERASKLLGHQGRIEVFVENELALRGGDLADVGPVRRDPAGVYYVPFEVTSEGAERFARASEGKAGYPGVIYLDRPDDSILLFTEEFKSKLSEDGRRDLELEGAEYDDNARMFRLQSRGGNAHWFYVQVPAVEIRGDSIPPESLEYLEGQKGVKSKVIYLGDLNELSENVVQGENLVYNGKPLFPIENVSRLKEELTTQWLRRVAGVKSWPVISEEIAGKLENIRTGLRITTGSSQEAEKEAEDLRVILSQRLPVEVSRVSETEIEPRLGRGFLREAAKAGAVAFLAVGLLVYVRYRRLKIAVPIMITMACELIITLGIASVIPSMTFGLPEIGGLIAVIGTGVDHQIIITDEVLAGMSPEGKLPIKRRVGRAFSIIFAAAATTIAAMFMLATLGFGAMRGFAIITILGVLISVLITRPAYAQIIGTLLTRETKRE